MYSLKVYKKRRLKGFFKRRKWGHFWSWPYRIILNQYSYREYRMIYLVQYKRNKILVPFRGINYKSNFSRGYLINKSSEKFKGWNIKFKAFSKRAYVYFMFLNYFKTFFRLDYLKLLIRKILILRNLINRGNFNKITIKYYLFLLKRFLKLYNFLLLSNKSMQKFKRFKFKYGMKDEKFWKILNKKNYYLLLRNMIIKRNFKFKKLKMFKKFFKRFRGLKKVFFSKKTTIALIFLRRRYTNYFITLTDLDGKVLVSSSGGKVSDTNNKKNKISDLLVPSMMTSIVLGLNRFKIKKVRLIILDKIKGRFYHKVLDFLKSYNIKIERMQSKIAIPHHLGKRFKKPRRL